MQACVPRTVGVALAALGSLLAVEAGTPPATLRENRATAWDINWEPRGGQ